MAHGFLTPQAVSGESPISKYFEKKVDELIGKGVKKLEDVARDKFNQFKNQLFKERRRDTTYRSGRGGVEVAGRYGIGNNTAVGGGILGGSSVKGLLPKKAGIVNTQAKVDIFGRNATDIDRKEGKYLPTSDPDVAGGPKTSKGRYVNMPGIAAAPTGGLKDSSFFSKTGELDIEKLRASGKSADEQKSIVRDYRASLRAKGVAPTGETAPPITPDSGADIVAALSKQTQEIVRLADLTKEQTKTHQSMHNEQQAHAEKLSSRALARSEERSLEKGSDLSGFTKAERFARLLPGAGGTGGGRGDGPIGGIGGKVLFRKGAEQVAKRGAARAGTRLAAKFGGKAAAKTVGKFGAKQAAKVGASAVGKSLGKKIPLVGLGLGAIFAAQRAMQGDFVGAGLELASGAASTVPGVGTVGSVGIDAALAARDMGMTPFANGGIITQPTAGLVGEAGQEGVFPLEGSRGKKTFAMFGEGLIEAQKKAKDEFSKIQAAGLKFYFQNQDGFKFFGDILKNVFAPFLTPLKALGTLKNLGGGLLNSLLGGPANAGELGGGLDPTISGDEEEYLMRLMIAEAGGEGELGMAAVARSVMNRAGLIQSGKVGAGTFMADSGSIMDVINAKNQYQPVREGKLKRDLTPEERARAKKALEMARNQASLRGNLEASGMDSASINNIMAATGFRTGNAFNDSSQNVNRTVLGNHVFNTAGNKDMLTIDAEVAANPGGPGSGSLASAAESLRGMSTRDGPGGGSVSCVYAVNKVFNKAGMTPPWGGAQDTLSAIRGMKAAGWQQVGFGEAQPGDVWVYDDGATKGHVGIKTADGKVLSNSSSKASFTWAADQSELLSWYPTAGLTPPGGTFFRPPSTDSVTQPANPIASTPLTAEQKSQMLQNAGMPALSANTLTSATPGPVPASPASPNTGNQFMATSAQVASASMHGGGPATVINNYYGGMGNNQSTGVNPNGVSAGIGMENTGTSLFQELRIRSLA